MKGNVRKIAGVMAGLCLALSAPRGSVAGPGGHDADNCTWYLSFEDFLISNKGQPQPMKLYLVRRGGQWIHAVGSSPKWNTSTHLADIAALKFAGGRLQGNIKVTLLPDPWVPADGKPISCDVEVDAKVDVRELDTEGAIEGVFRSASRSGKLTGKLAAPKMSGFQAATLILALTEGLEGAGQPYHRRLLVQLDVREGKVVGGQFSPADMKCAPTALQPLGSVNIDLGEHRFSGELAFDYEILGAVGEAAATYKIAIADGKRVDDLLGGKFTATVSRPNHKDLVRQNGFKGWVRPAQDVARSIWAVEKDDRPWFAPAKNWKPVEPGEHPRLFFRRGDLPELRRRAATPEGKALLARLRATLGGGESMPEHYQRAQAAYDKNATRDLPEGAYTISHAAGFGLLFQLTGEKRYAALARTCVELGFQGQRDRDDRYSWVAPGGELRAGPSIAWYAAAYDLCYDGWDDGFRRRVALAIQNYRDDKAGEWGKAEGISLEAMATMPKQTPASNHYAAVVGGAGIAVLAILGDPGTDSVKLHGYLRHIERNTVLALSKGFGDHGYFSENAGPSHVAANGAFVPFLQAMKVAAGRDYFTPRPNAQWLTLRWVMELVPDRNGRPCYPLRRPSNYGGRDFLGEHGGISHGGWFAQGFGAVGDEYQPALLWTYNHFVAEADRHAFTAKNYPHYAMLAFVNWPIGVQPRNPAESLPRALVDKVHGYYVFRNRWQDRNDAIVTALLASGPKGHISIGPTNVMVWGLGEQITFGDFRHGSQTTHYQAADDGSGSLAASDGTCLAVDFSGACGADVLVVMTGPGAKGGQKVWAGSTEFAIVALPTGQPPKIEVAGNTMKIGRQTVSFDGNKIVLGTLAALGSPLRTGQEAARRPSRLSHSGNRVVPMLNAFPPEVAILTTGAMAH